MKEVLRAETFEEFVARERERLGEKKKEIQTRQKSLMDELTAVDREMEAIQAYEAAKEGKVVRIASSGTRAPRGAQRTRVLDAVKSNPEGMGRADILEVLGVKGDKSGEQSVSNALSALKKARNIDSKDGKYVVV